MSWHMSPRYGHGILVSGYSVLTAVNWPYCEFRMLKTWTCQDSPETPLSSFWYIVSPTPPAQSVDAYVRTLGQSRDNQTKSGWPYSMSMGLCPTRTSRARGCPSIIYGDLLHTLCMCKSSAMKLTVVMLVLILLFNKLIWTGQGKAILVSVYLPNYQKKNFHPEQIGKSQLGKLGLFCLLK